MKKMAMRSLCLALVISAFMVFPLWGQEKVRLGVYQFESKVAGVSQKQANAVMDMMTRALANSKSISLIERAELDKVGAEIRLGMSGLVDAGTAAEVGRIAGLQYILLGAVTELSKKASGGAIPIFGGIGVASGSEEMQATIDLRVVDTSTAEVTLALSETGYSSNEASGVMIAGAVVAEGTFDGLESRAIADAVSRLAAQVRNSLGGESSHILAVQGKEATIDIGSSMGAKEGALYLVYADGETILGINNEVIGRKKVALGVLKVRDTAANYSTCIFVKGSKSELVRRGDKIEPISPKKLKKIKYASSRPAKSSDTFEQIFGSKDGAGKQKTTPNSVASTPAKSESKKASEVRPVPATKKPAPSSKKIAGFDPNNSTDSKVIQTYPLSAGDKNMLGIMHRNAYNKFKRGRYKDAYKGFAKAVDSYASVNYLSAYWAGVSAYKLREKEKALEWIDKALSINPDYVPAQEYKAKKLKK
ncbi:MAG: hypothetical protein CSA35_06240 [Dethiosulfovibrio peptidovorans]|nr:MAG: hypothetical protein CSA35_06240 [Dethiosulfovibrio peptidovorans]